MLTFVDQTGALWMKGSPRESDFENGIIDAFYQGVKNRPDSTFGTLNDDVLALKEAQFHRTDMCSVILNSRWANRRIESACMLPHEGLGSCSQG
jgi:hypothetical protein